MTLRGYKVPIAFSLIAWCLLWEVVGRLGLISLIPPFTEVLGAMPEVMWSPSFAEAARITFQAYGIGMALSLTIGIGMGILMGRVRAIGELMGMWVNIFESSPLTAVVPALIALLGFGLSTMILFFAALPELLAGIRLGLIRGLKGVIIGQLLIAVVGMGYLFELYSRSFLMPQFWALLILLFASAFLASEVVAYFERKVSFYATAR
jgi:NitT/TauT family transport system permease protein